LSFIIGALKIIILLGFLVLIHEGGHFLVAKKCNVKVLEFSIGFGKELFSKQGKETKYTLRIIPLGGYCKMLGEEEAVEDDRAFNKATIGKRLLIVFAGAFVNIVFGLITFWILASIYNKNLYDGLIVTKRYVVSIFQSIAMLFGKNSEAAVVGPVGISKMIVQTNRII
jgi:regulator of sigma E protease